MEKRRIEELKRKTEEILKNIQIDISVGDTCEIDILQEIKEKEIEDDEIDLLERTVRNIENYFETKRKSTNS